MVAATVIFILKAYFIFTVAVMTLYGVRHYWFTYNRLYCRQRLYYQDIIDSDLPRVSVLIPMHNEELVAHGVLDALLASDYPRELMEIIPINDHSSDGTREILDGYAAKYPLIRPLHRDTGPRGKPGGLNDAMELATGDIVIVFDADYVPAVGLVRQLALAFLDPEVGAVMGRVIPINVERSPLTRLLDLERTGGYQIDQQARYNLGLVPQYGGTVGGYRRDLMRSTGGFLTDVLAEDTELTYRFFCSGWKVVYANSAECYEESPESWEIRGRQIQRWARGHNQVMWRYLIRLLTNRYMGFVQKLDGLLLLLVYAMPVVLFLGLLDSLALFFLDEMSIVPGLWFLLFLGIYNTAGNFAPFFQIGSGCFLDGSTNRVLLLPYVSFNFYFYMWAITKGFMQSILDIVLHRTAAWNKTQRYRKEGDKT